MKAILRSVTVIVAFSAATLLLPRATLSQESRFYLKGDLGGNLTTDTEATVRGNAAFGANLGGTEFGFTARFDPGAHVGFTTGYRVTDWFAAEAEIGATVNTVESIPPGRGAALLDGTFASVPLLFNVKLQYPNRSRWTPYIGGGVGPSAAILDADVLIAGNRFTTFRRIHLSDVDAVLAYQAFAGLRYKLNDRMGLSVEYRYLTAESPEWALDLIPPEQATLTFGNVHTHAISLAFDYRF